MICCWWLDLCYSAMKNHSSTFNYHFSTFCLIIKLDLCHKTFSNKSTEIDTSDIRIDTRISRGRQNRDPWISVRDRPYMYRAILSAGRNDRNSIVRNKRKLRSRGWTEAGNHSRIRHASQLSCCWHWKIRLSKIFPAHVHIRTPVVHSPSVVFRGIGGKAVGQERIDGKYTVESR